MSTNSICACTSYTSSKIAPTGSIGPTGIAFTGPTGFSTTGPTGPTGPTGGTGPTGPFVEGPTNFFFSSNYVTFTGNTGGNEYAMVLSLTTTYTEITNYNFNLPIPQFTLADSTQGTLKIVSLSDDKNAPTQINTQRGQVIIQAAEPLGASLLFSENRWINVPFASNLSWFPQNQQNGKLVGSGYSGSSAQQGSSIALSADGNTLAIGAQGDNANNGACWIFCRTSTNVWLQQTKLSPTDSIQGQFGTSVALSADGNILVSGGPTDNSNRGAVWIYTRTTSTSPWIENVKIVGTADILNGGGVAISADGATILTTYADGAGTRANHIFYKSSIDTTWIQQAGFVGSVQGAASRNSGAISSDGNIVAIGDYNYSANTGVVWMFVNTGGSWIQKSQLLSSGSAYLGYSVAISADGNTVAAGGGFQVNPNIGGVWIFSRENFSQEWTQQGPEIVGIGYSNSTNFVLQGASLALSGDGNTLAFGGYGDVNERGSTWIWMRSSQIWTQQGVKLFGSGFSSSVVWEGFSVALSADGGTMAVGGPVDQDDGSNLKGIGATWIFT